MARMNRMGAVYTDVLSLYPGTVAADYDAGGASGQTKIEAVLDRTTREVAAALTPDAYRQMTQVNAELVVRYATAGQTTATLGLLPAIAGTLHVWRYPMLGADAADIFSRQSDQYWVDWYGKPPQLGVGEVPSANVSLVAATGVITLPAGTLSLGDRLYASYDVDVDSASFSMPSLRDIVLLGAAAECGRWLFSQGTQEWSLVEDFRTRYVAMITAMREGALVPDELRKLSYYEPVERNSPEVTSVRIWRG